MSRDHESVNRFTTRKCECRSKCLLAELHDRFFRQPCCVGSEHATRQAPERMRLRRRFLFKYIDARSPQTTLQQSIDECLFIDQSATGRVENDRVFAHPRKFFAPDQRTCLLGKRHVK